MSLWFGSSVLASAAVINVFADSVARISPALGAPVPRASLIFLAFVVFAVINIRGVKLGSGVVQTVTVAKLAPLLILIAVGLFFVQPVNLAWPGMPASGEIARTSVTLMFAFLGIESALTPSGEVNNPARTVPRAIFYTLVIVTLVYVGLQVVAQGVLGGQLAENTTAPLAATAARVLGRGGELLVLVGAAVSTLGYVGGDMLAAPRSIYALGRDGLLPDVIGRVHERFRTPHVAIVIHAVLCAGFAVTGSFAALIILATLACLIVYFVCCLATIKLQRMNVRADGAIPFNVPGGPVIPVIASLVVVWLMASSTRQEFIALGAMLAVQTLIYLAMRATRPTVPATS
jgi:amino acid transporter